MKLNRLKAINLNKVLSNPELKIKYINGESYAKLLYLKRKLRNSIDELVEIEQEAAKDCKYDETKPETIKEFSDKLVAIQSKFEVEVYEPFLTLEEFKHYAEMLDTETASILAEFLLKDFNE
jgi:hypothetical protein